MQTLGGWVSEPDGKDDFHAEDEMWCLDGDVDGYGQLTVLEFAWGEGDLKHNTLQHELHCLE